MNAYPIDVAGYDKTIAHVVHLGLAALGIRLSLRATAKPPWLATRELARYVGRCQVGEGVSLFSNCIPGGPPIWPIAAGTFRIYGGVHVRAGMLPLETTDEETVGLFRGYFKADQTDRPGRYSCLISYRVAGLARAVAECLTFELVPGGHQLGAILSTFPMLRPTGTTVLAHTESGKITQGHLPYLDEGVT
jgi:hypothetical protein